MEDNAFFKNVFLAMDKLILNLLIIVLFVMFQEGSGSRDSLTSLNSQFSLTENQIKVTSFLFNLISWKIMYSLEKVQKLKIMNGQNIEKKIN